MAARPPPPNDPGAPPPRADPPLRGSDLDMDLDFIAFDDSPPPQPAQALPTSRFTHGNVPKFLQPPGQLAGHKRGHDELYDEATDEDRRKKTLREERKENGREIPWASNVDWHLCRNVTEMFNMETVAFVRYIQPTVEENRVRGYLIDLIGQSIQRRWSDATVYAFGSYETGLYLPTGDIDLVVQSESMMSRSRPNVLKDMALIIRQDNIAQGVRVIVGAKVPIIKFTTNYGAFDVDISINSDNGIQACHVVKQYINYLPALRPLVFLVKWFLAQRNLNEVFTGGLGSYAITCFCASFLQHHPKLRRCEMNPLKNLGVLFLEFLDFYGRTFDNDTMGISIRNGGSYFKKTSRPIFRNNKAHAFCVEDPQNPDNDISGGTFNVVGIKQAFTGSYQAITAALQTREREWRRRNAAPDGHPDAMLWVGKSGGPDDRAMSILGSVIGLESKVVKHRRDVKDTYNKGALQHLLRIGKTQPASSLQADGGPPYIPMTGFSFAKPSQKPKGGGSGGTGPSNYEQRGATTANAIMVDDDEMEDGELEEEAANGTAAGPSGSYYHDLSEDDVGEKATGFSDAKRDGKQGQSEPDLSGLSKSARKKRRRAAKAAVEQAAMTSEQRANVSTGSKKRRAKKELLEAKARQAQDADDSRYAIGSKADKGDEPFTVDDSESEDASGSGVEDENDELDEAQKPEPVLTKGGKPLRTADRYAFWAAKGGVGADDEFDMLDGSAGTGDTDAIEANEDFVKF